MKPEQRQYIKKYLEEMESLMITKGEDYSGDEDNLKNFRFLDEYGYDTKIGILFRMSDKVSRIACLLKSGKVQNHENLHQNLVDLSNYACLLDECIWDEAQRKKADFPGPVLTPVPYVPAPKPTLGVQAGDQAGVQAAPTTTPVPQKKNW